MQSNKKAVSGIVTTVLIVLIVLAAIVIVWNVVKKTVTEGSEDVGTEQFTVSLSTSQVDLSQDPIQVPVTRNAGAGDIIAIKFIFIDKTGNSYAYEETDPAKIPGELETINYLILREQAGIPFTATLISFKVYPVIAVSENKNVTGMPATGGGTTTPTPPVTTYTFYRDVDGDKYSDGTTETKTENNPSQWFYNESHFLALSGDCDDGPIVGANYNPGIVESSANGNTFDGIDQNCDGGDNLQTCGTINVADAVYFIDNDVSTTTTCLTINANSITINMAGYNIAGNPTMGVSGIVNTGGYNSTTVMNGYFYGFKIGIYSVGGYNGNFTNLTIADSSELGANSYGIYLYGNNNYITNNNISNIVNDGAYGIYLYSSSNNTIQNNIANSNTGINSGYGIYFDLSSNNNTLTNNTANSNRHSGIYLSSSSNNNILTNNNVCNNNFQDLYCLSTGMSGTGNTFGTGKVTVCSNPAWPNYPTDYSYCP